MHLPPTSLNAVVSGVLCHTAPVFTPSCMISSCHQSFAQPILSTMQYPSKVHDISNLIVCHEDNSLLLFTLQQRQQQHQQLKMLNIMQLPNLNFYILTVIRYNILHLLKHSTQMYIARIFLWIKNWECYDNIVKVKLNKQFYLVS